MSVDTLRRAAAVARAEWGSPDDQRRYPEASRRHLAVADWLDREADLAITHDAFLTAATAAGLVIRKDETTLPQALAVALAYLGQTS